MILAAREGHGPIRVSAHAGEHRYVHCAALGKALLAALPAADVTALIRAHGLPARTPHTITTLPRLWRDLALIQRRGFAVSVEESTLGVASIGAPIRTAGDLPRAALAVSVAAQDIRSKQALHRLAEHVLTSAERIAAAAARHPSATIRPPNP